MAAKIERSNVTMFVMVIMLIYEYEQDIDRMINAFFDDPNYISYREHFQNESSNMKSERFQSQMEIEIKIYNEKISSLI